MPWKVNDAGTLETQDNKPVYVGADGKEAAVDLDQINSEWAGKHNAVVKESMGRKETIRELTTKVEAFDDLDPEEAKVAIKTVANYKDKDLIAAKDSEAAKAAILKNAEAEKAKLTEKLEKAHQDIRKLGISNAFAHSTFFKEKTTLLPDAAEAIFGGSFQVEDGIVVANDKDGNPIFGATSGDRAGFEEAAAILWELYPHKEHYKPQATGGGAPSEGGRPPGGKTDLQGIESGIKDAREKGDIEKEVALTLEGHKIVQGAQ